MRLPDFLVIGAMKSGSTSFYHDLLVNRNIFLPDKETGCLLTDLAIAEYSALYQQARPDQICGEVSVSYAMLPKAIDVVPRAKRLLSSDTKIIYLVREPVARTLSHHRHMCEAHGEDRMEPNINEEIARRPELVDYSRYAMQLRPWLEAFGRQSIYIICFEDYIANRVATVAAVSRFLGVEPQTARIESDVAHNQSEGKPIVLNDFWNRVTHSLVYRRVIRPMFAQRSRDRFRQWLLPKAHTALVPSSLETIDKIIALVQEDVAELTTILELNRPLWDLATVHARYAEMLSTTEPSMEKSEVQSV
jgi:hypothetical protein